MSDDTAPAITFTYALQRAAAALDEAGLQAAHERMTALNGIADSWIGIAALVNEHENA